MRFLDAVSLAKLKSLSLRLGRLASESHAQGRHKSVFKGYSRDFAQHRAYAPGDEPRTLDWKVYARTDRFYVKEFMSESVLSGHVLLDASGSMGFSTQGRAPKWDYACRLAMALGYLILSRGDAAGLLAFGAGAGREVPAKKSLAHLSALDDALSELSPRGEADLPRALGETALRLRRRSLVVVISDLLGPPDQIIAAMRGLRARKNRLVVLQVIDPAERDFPFDGPTEFESLETGERFFCEASVLRQTYREEFARDLSLYEASFAAMGAAYAPCPTDIPWDAALKRLLASLR
ncbi:MAG TPA: DUF58 domain-containing protein [Elusimicrobiota bacterium]|nr:DUF58 domain-containing protein [Elusimicrobiota bacterium]